MRKKKLFDFVIGNPPYQEPREGTSDKPVYNFMMEASYKIAEKAEFITPSRFLFNAGNTPKSWNDKMLHDSSFKVLKYEKDGTKVFPNTDIKGGVVITYRDRKKNFGEIGVFISDPELKGILHKVLHAEPFSSISKEIYAPESYKFTDVLYKEHPEIHSMTFMYKDKEKPLISKGHDYDLTSNIFDKLDGIVFFVEKPNSNQKYVRIEGRKYNRRCIRWIKHDYIAPHANFNKYKILFPKSNGSGKFGDQMSSPIIADPEVGHTQTFLSIGGLDTKKEAEAEIKYIKTKFVRTVLGILKVTQDNKRNVWKYVPIQDFTSKSDIDWSKSVHEIDLQLYKKYGLDEREIDFIESHVKEMA
jgi:type II restriction enzyme